MTDRTPTELADWGIKHGGMMVQQIEDSDPRLVSLEVRVLAEFAVEAANTICELATRLRELEGEPEDNPGEDLGWISPQHKVVEGERRIEGTVWGYGIKKGLEYITLGVPFGAIPSPMPQGVTLTFQSPKEEDDG